MARQGFHSHHYVDELGNPRGGQTGGVGFGISWQDGPLGRGAEQRPPNGAFVEDIIAAAADRLYFYQESKFKCPENADAIVALKEALRALESRTARRESEGVEGFCKDFS